MRIDQTDHALVINLIRILDPKCEPGVQQRGHAAIAIEAPGQLWATHVMEHENVGFEFNFVFLNVKTSEDVVFKSDRSVREVDRQGLAFVAVL